MTLDELEDRIEQIFDAIEKLHEVGGDGRIARQLLDSIFRNVHSLKASAAANDLPDLARITHEFETILQSLRTGKMRMTDEVFGAFYDISDAMFANVRPETANTASLDSLFRRVHSLSEPTSQPEEVSRYGLTEDVWESLSEEEKHRVKLTVQESGGLFLLSVSFDVASFDEQFKSLQKLLIVHGEIISTAPTFDKGQPDKVEFRILFGCELDVDNLKERIPELELVNINQIVEAAGISHSSQLQHSGKRMEASSSSRYLRIELDDLDRLISSTQRLFRETNECFASASDRIPKSEVDSVSASFMQLAADLVNLRMVPIDRVLKRAYRAGRSAAAAADKQVRFEITDDNMSIDKSLSDTIADPLIHLVRNAVDHGIETEAERVKLGKDRHGNIRIHASTLQGRTTIKVIDDGRGIDPELVSDTARRLGLVSKDVQVSIEQSVRLIFRAGFSTAANVSTVSGRGVGLDVVETAIEEVGGAIRVESQLGVGSVFEILLPVTFSLIDAVVVRAGKFRYVIESKYVRGNDDREQMTEKEIPRFKLDQLLGFDGADSEAAATQLLCKFEGWPAVNFINLHVTELLGNEQVLVRSLGSRGGRWIGIAGATEMRDGTVALLLDLPALISALLQ